MILGIALGLVVLCFFVAKAIVFNAFGVLPILLAMGICLMGIFVFLFLIKFIFKRHKEDHSHLVDIKRYDEPELFKLIDEITAEAGVRFPKKVLLSAEVNASVFYNSSFWSMFFPVRKNLQIGLGLINVLTRSELKAVLAHEFGHFSQRTMKLGSYVYQANQVVFHIVNDDEAISRLMTRTAQISAVVAFFIITAARINNGFQWILAKVYVLLNTTYLGLSRQMEFHADEIAAHIAGSIPSMRALQRLNLAQTALDNVLEFYEEKSSTNVCSTNLYTEQTYVMHFLAKKNDIPYLDNWLVPEEAHLAKFNKSKLTIGDQWASHPQTSERLLRIAHLGIPAKSSDNTSANTLLKDAAKRQEQLTRFIFSRVTYESNPTPLTAEAFQSGYVSDFSKNTFPDVFRRYYDSLSPLPFDIPESSEESVATEFAELFSDTQIDLAFSHTALQNDISVIEQIAVGDIRIRTFDYAGRKYKRKEASVLAEELKVEGEALRKRQLDNDLRIFQYFIQLEKAHSSELMLQELYKNFFSTQEKFQERQKLYHDISSGLSFVHETTPHAEIITKFLSLEQYEDALKAQLTELLSDPLYQQEIKPELHEQITHYLMKQWSYFDHGHYRESNLQMLFVVLNGYFSLIHRGLFLHKKHLLAYQASLLRG